MVNEPVAELSADLSSDSRLLDISPWKMTPELPQGTCQQTGLFFLKLLILFYDNVWYELLF